MLLLRMRTIKDRKKKPKPPNFHEVFTLFVLLSSSAAALHRSSNCVCANVSPRRDL